MCATPRPLPPAVTHYYGMFIHVSIMIFIGFGYLMTFLKRYGYSAIGYNFMLSCFAFLWNVLVRGLCVFLGHLWAGVVCAAFCAVCVCAVRGVVFVFAFVCVSGVV